MRITRGLALALAAGALSLMLSGCLRKALLNGQIKSTRDGSAAINTLHDYEVARAAGTAGLGTLEGMHTLAPENTDALFMLTRGWGGATFAFTEDDYEDALAREDEVEADYHLMRSRAGWNRAVHYGIELLGHYASGFEDARRNKDTMRAWLVENFNDPKQAEDLLWTGYAWIGRVASSSDMPELVGELYVGVEITRRSIELEEDAVYATGHTILGAYHARTAQAELDDSKKHFERALELNKGKFLPTALNFAHRYYCAKRDKKTWEKMLNDVIAAGDDLPEARLQNIVAKRRALRYLNHQDVFTENCAFDL